MDIKDIKDRRARGKTADGTWVYGYFVFVYPDSYRIYGKDGTYIEVQPETVGWYTGIDSNEHEEVYEGDYVEYVTNCEKVYPLDMSSEPRKGKAIIGYDDIGFTIKSIDGQVLDSFMLFMFYEDWHCAAPDPDFRIIRVLGNRWDNPEIQVIPPKYEVEVGKLPF